MNGGLNGGWDDFDHNNFIKFYKNPKLLQDPENFLQTCLINLPGKSIEQIKEHRIWYEQFLILLEEKKSAIENWKRVKNFEKNSKISKGKIVFINQEDSLIEDQNDKFEKLKAELAKKRELERRNRDKAKIAEWRENKENVAKILELEKLERDEHEQELKKREKEKYQAQQQAELNLYRVEKQALSELEQEKRLAEQAETERQRRERVAKNSTKFFNQNQKIMVKKALKNEILAEEEMMKNRRLERLKSTVKGEIKVERSFDRLTKPTKAHENRKNSEYESTRPMTGSRCLPSRNIPSWRAGVNF